MAKTLRQLADAIGAELIGEEDRLIERVASLPQADGQSISFISNPQFKSHLESTRAGAVILSADYAADCPVSKLITPNPYLGYARIAALLNPLARPAPGAHSSAVIDPEASVDPSAALGPQCVIEAGARVEADVVIGPGCVVGRNVTIGRGSRLVANVTVCADSRIGERVIIHPGAVIGADGFGLANERGRWVKIPQLGRVVLGDDVEIGANTCVDRGALEDTIVGEGVKLDNLIQIAHNVRIGEHTAIAGTTGIAGSVVIGRQCMVGGGTNIAGHLNIADNVTITGASVVTRTISEPGVYSSTLTVQPQQTWNRALARMIRLEEMARKIKELEKQVRDLLSSRM